MSELSERQPVTNERYEVLEIIARNRRSMVLAARDSLSGERRALKLLTDPTAEPFDRLLKAYEALTDVSHRSVVKAHGIETFGESHHALVLELIQGSTLVERLGNRPPISVGEMTETLKQIALALQAVHDAGWIHCDVKPSNIMLRDDFTPVLIDFGAARRLDEFDAAPFCGSPQYSSPEQLRLEPLDPRTDVFSLGACAFAILTGQPPFPAHEAARQPAPSMSEVSGIPFPQDLENTVASTLALDRDERPRSMRVVAALFDALHPETLGFLGPDAWGAPINDEPTVPIMGRDFYPTPLRIGTMPIPAQRLLNDVRVSSLTRCVIRRDGTAVIAEERDLIEIRGDGAVELLFSLPESRVRAIAVGPRDELIVGTDDGHIFARNRKGRVADLALLSSPVEQIGVGEHVAVVRSTDGAVHVTRNRFRSWWCQLCPCSDTIAVSPNGLWCGVATGAGIVRFRIRPNSVEPIDEFAIPGEARHLAIDDVGRVVAGTEVGGIFVRADGIAQQVGRIAGLCAVNRGLDRLLAAGRRDGRLQLFAFTTDF